VYEALLTVVVAIVLVVASALGAFRRPDGIAWLAAVGGWAVARVVVATTWRDAPVLGPLRAEQLLAIGLVATCVLVGLAMRRPWAARARRGSIVGLEREALRRDTTDPALSGSEERT
jgi:hypothetical protein